MYSMPGIRSKRNALVLAVVGWMVVFPNALAQTPAAAERSKQIKITIGSKTFNAALEDNATVRAFKALLPMKVNITELNGNEKYFPLSDNLPTNASNPGTIQTGDLMIY